MTMPIYMTGARRLFGGLLMFALLIPSWVSADDIGPGAIIKNSTDPNYGASRGRPGVFRRDTRALFSWDRRGVRCG